jgi:hypothetical protein
LLLLLIVVVVVAAYLAVWQAGVRGLDVLLSLKSE